MFFVFSVLDIFVSLKCFRRISVDTPVWRVNVSVLYCVFLIANYMSLMLGRGWLVVGGSEGLGSYQLIVFFVSFVMTIFHLRLI